MMVSRLDSMSVCIVWSAKVYKLMVA